MSSISRFTTPTMSTALDHQADKSAPSPQAVLNELLKDPRFATLRTGNGFSRIKEMGIDAVLGIRWVLNNQNTLCPLGYSNPRNRLGALFNQGLCVKNDSAVEIAKGLNKVEAALSGASLQAKIGNRSGGFYQTVLKPSSIIDNPIADLRKLTPLVFDRCNQLIGVADGSVAGLFPKGDGNTVLQLSSSCR